MLMHGKTIHEIFEMENSIPQQQSFSLKCLNEAFFFKRFKRETNKIQGNNFV